MEQVSPEMLLHKKEDVYGVLGEHEVEALEAGAGRRHLVLGRPEKRT